MIDFTLGIFLFMMIGSVVTAVLTAIMLIGIGIAEWLKYKYRR